MDKLLYIAMSGAKENMNSLAVRSNNLANANTLGFKADFEQARAMQAYGDGLPSRVFSMSERPGQSWAGPRIFPSLREGRASGTVRKAFSLHPPALRQRDRYGHKAPICALAGRN